MYTTAGVAASSRQRQSGVAASSRQQQPDSNAHYLATKLGNGLFKEI